MWSRREDWQQVTPKKKKPSTISRACGIIVALVIFVIALWFGFNAQQGGYDLIMFVAYGIAALSFLLCIGIGTGKVTPATYMGTLDM